MLQATTDSFVSTIQTADALNASTVTRGWRALATLGSLAAAIIVGILWSHHSDNIAKKVTPMEDVKAKSAPLSLDIAKATKKSDKGGSRKVRFNSRSKKALVNAELAIVEDSLPRVLSSRTFTDRFLEEVKQHHRWFGIIFYFSDSFPRVLRVVSLATNAIVMLFIQSITYNLTNPDDGTCEAMSTETDCLQPKSPFATGESKCAWLVDQSSHSSSTSLCVFVEPDQSVRIILFVAVFCAIVTTPIALSADWVVLNILCAPTKVEVMAEQEADAATAATTAASAGVHIAQRAQLPTAPQTSKHELDGASAVVPVADLRKTLSKTSSSNAVLSYMGIFNNNSNTEKAKDDALILAASRAELLMLSLRLRKYRDTLAPSELEEFNLLWGLDADGKFITTTADTSTTLLGRIKARFFKREDVNVKEAVLMDLKRINETVHREAAALKAANAPKFEIGRKLLFLFQCDLLPGISGKILDLKGSRDAANVKHVSVQAKIAGWTFLFLLDAGMLFYILLFSLTQTGPRQNAWFQSFALWLVVEILLVSTAIVFFTHILVPSLIMKDITQIKRRLMDNIRDFNDKVQESKDGAQNGIAKTCTENEESTRFNAASFLFVSTRLARQFPDLKESKIIAHFSTPWPRQSYLRVQNVSKKYSKKFSALTRSASILLIFFVGNFLSVPPSIQDILVQMTTTTAVGYTLLIHVELFEIFPALVILPALLLLLVVHFFIQSGKADAQLKLARLFPTNPKKNKTAATVDETSIAVVVGEDAEHKHDEGKSSDDEYDYGYGSGVDSSGDGAIAVPVVNPHSAHKTRRQSITAGLDLIHSMQERARRGEAALQEASGDSSDCSVSSEESDASCAEEEQLHTAKGTQNAFHRVLSRGVPFLNRSRASNYSVDLSIPSNSTAGSGDDSESDSNSSSDGSNESAADDASDVSSQLSDTNCSSSSASSTDTDDDDDDDSALHDDHEAVGELNKAYRSYSVDAHSLSTISNQVPGHLRDPQSEMTEDSTCDTESVIVSPLQQTVLPICTPPGNPGIGDIPLPATAIAEEAVTGGDLSPLTLHVAISASPAEDSSSESDSNSIGDSEGSGSGDQLSDLSASELGTIGTEAAHARRLHLATQDLLSIQIVYEYTADLIQKAGAPPVTSLSLAQPTGFEPQSSESESGDSHSNNDSASASESESERAEAGLRGKPPSASINNAHAAAELSDSASCTSGEGEEEEGADSASTSSSSGYESAGDM